MKKIIALVLLGSLTAIGGQLTQTTAQIQTAISGQLGECILGHNGNIYTNGIGITFTNIVPAAGFSEIFDGSSDWTANTNGTFTANFTGTFIALATGSFEKVGGGGGVDVQGHWFVDSTDKGAGFIRTLDVNKYGSFAGPSGPIAVTSGEVVSFRLNAPSGSENVGIHDIQLNVRRLD